MKKVVFNQCYGGFGLSADALYLLFLMKFPLKASPFVNGDSFPIEEFTLEAPEGIRAHKSFPILLKDDVLYTAALDQYSSEGMALRSHPILVQVVEKLGARANGGCANLAIKELEDDTMYAIEEYDGFESVRILSTDNYVTGYKMTPVAIPETGFTPRLSNPRRSLTGP